MPEEAGHAGAPEDIAGEVRGLRERVRDLEAQLASCLAGAPERAERLLEAAQEIAKLGGWEYDLQTGGMSWTDEVYRIHGLPVDPGIDHVATSLASYPGEARETIEAAYRACLEQGASYDLVLPFITVAGEARWVRTAGKAEYESGEIVRVVGHIMDITETRLAEDRLRLQALVLGQIQDRVTVTDLDGIITHVNRAEEESLGWSREELIGRSVETYGEDPSRGARQSEIIEETRKRGEWRGRVVNFAADGRRILLDCRTSVVRDEQGKPVALCGISTDITAMESAVAALRESEAKYRRLAENSPAAVFQFRMAPDGAFSFPYVSEAIESLTGVSAVEAMRDPDLLLGAIHPQDQRPFRESVHESARTLAPYHRVVRHIRDGEVAWAEVRATPSSAADGGVLWDGFLVDITERKRSEDQAKASHQRLLSIFDGVDEPVYVADPETHEVLYVNQASRENWGEPEGRRCYEYLQDRDAPCPFCTNDRIFGEWLGRSYVWEFQNEINRHWYRCIDKAIAWPDGRMVRYEMAVDVTERKRAEAALAGSELKARSILNASPAAIALLDRDGRVLDCNEAYPARFGRTRDELVGERVWELFPSDVASRRRAQVETVFETGQPVHTEDERDGMVNEYTICPVPGASGEIEAVVVNALDITAQVRLREEKEALEAQYRQAQKMEAVGTLAGGIAHDFNNILQGIIGYTSLSIEELPVGDPIRENLEEVRKAGDRAASLTRQLLLFSRRVAFEPRTLDLQETLADLSRMLVRLIGEHIALTLDAGRDLRPIFADPGQIEQIVMNLCVNARDAMPEGGTIRISTGNCILSPDDCAPWPDARPGDYVRLCVEDTGCGIPPETQARIFEPFFTTKEVGEGSGLGLATVYAIAGRHRGIVTVDSEVGRGSAFSVYLPASAGLPPPAKAASGRSGRAQSGGRALGGRETILLAEDDGIVRSLATRVLTAAGYQVIVARDGAEATRLLRERKDDIGLAVLDVVMPKLSGVKVEAAAREAGLHIPVLFCSGYSHEDIDTTHLPAERRLLRKPFSPEVLLRAVREAIDGSNEERESRP